MKAPICPRCQTKFRNIQSGVTVVEMFLDPPQPYKLWLADLFECPSCRARIVSGFANRAYVEHYEQDFAEKYAALAAKDTFYSFERVPELG